MKARKFLVLRVTPATSAKSTLILYLGYLRDENLSPNEKKFIKSLERFAEHLLYPVRRADPIDPSSFLCRITIFGNFKRTKTVVLLDVLIEQ